MDSGIALIVWALVAIVIFLLLYILGINWWASLAFALLIAAVVLLVIYPFRAGQWRGEDALASAIVVISLIVAFIYFIVKVFSDRRKPGGC